MEKTLAEVNSEIAILHDAKESCERALEAKALPHDITTGNRKDFLPFEILLHYFPFLEHYGLALNNKIGTFIFI